MCHYITAVLPKSAALAELDAIARAHGREFRPLSNPSIEAQIEPDESYFITTPGYCDCGTSLGALARAQTREPDWSAQEARLLRKGWSKSKVARSLEQKRSGFLANAHRSDGRNRTDACSFLALIRSVLDSGKATKLGLLLHWYSGSVESRVDIASRECVSLSSLTPEFIGHMQEDVLYVFRR